MRYSDSIKIMSTPTSQTNSDSYQIKLLLISQCEYQYDSLLCRVSSVRQSGLVIATLALSLLWLTLAAVDLSTNTGVLYVVVVGSMILVNASLWAKSIYSLPEWEPAPTLAANQCSGSSDVHHLELHLKQYISAIEANKTLVRQSARIWLLAYGVSMVATMIVMVAFLWVIV